MDIKIDISSHCSLSFNFLVVLFCTVTTKITDAQTSNVSLYTFSDFTPTISSSFVKVFTTSIQISSTRTSSLDEAVFLNAANEFYSSSLNGFDSVVLLTNSTNAINQTEISFEIRYTVTALIQETDAAVINAIGNLTVLKTGLEADASFNALYSVSTDESTFAFSGNLICPSVTCGGSYAFCTESSLGLSLSCKSDCFGRFTCENDGVCVHQTPTRSPSCSCLAAATVWYIGGRCEYKVEVWMIVVFLLGFVAVICLIILIGCLCCRRKIKSEYRDEEYPSPSGNAQHKLIPKEPTEGVTEHQTHLQSNNGKIPQGQQPVPLADDMETDISAAASPLTSAALVTVQESSTESEASSTSRVEQGLNENSQSAPLAENELALAGDPESSDRDSTDSSETSSQNGATQAIAPISGIESQSIAESDVPVSQSYDALQFPDLPRSNNEEYAKLTLV